MKDYVIRSANDHDYQHLLNIEIDAATAFAQHPEYAELCTEPTAGDYYRKLSEDEGKIFVAESTEKPNTIIAFSLLTFADKQPHLKEIDVLQAHAQKGIGTKLLKKNCDWSKRNGYQFITLTTFRDLIFNGPFYKKNGFEIFEPDNDWKQLRNLRRREIDSGLDIRPRVAMIKSL